MRVKKKMRLPIVGNEIKLGGKFRKNSSNKTCL